MPKKFGDSYLELCTWGSQYGAGTYTRAAGSHLSGKNPGHAALRIVLPIYDKDGKINQQNKALIEKYCGDGKIPYFKRVIATKKMKKNEQGQLVNDTENAYEEEAYVIHFSLYEAGKLAGPKFDEGAQRGGRPFSWDPEKLKALQEMDKKVEIDLKVAIEAYAQLSRKSNRSEEENVKLKVMEEEYGELLKKKIEKIETKGELAPKQIKHGFREMQPKAESNEEIASYQFITHGRPPDNVQRLSLNKEPAEPGAAPSVEQLLKKMTDINEDRKGTNFYRNCCEAVRQVLVGSIKDRAYQSFFRPQVVLPTTPQGLHDDFSKYRQQVESRQKLSLGNRIWLRTQNDKRSPLNWPLVGPILSFIVKGSVRIITKMSDAISTKRSSSKSISPSAAENFYEQAEKMMYQEKIKEHIIEISSPQSPKMAIEKFIEYSQNSKYKNTIAVFDAKTQSAVLQYLSKEKEPKIKQDYYAASDIMAKRVYKLHKSVAVTLPPSEILSNNGGITPEKTKVVEAVSTELIFSRVQSKTSNSPSQEPPRSSPKP